MEVKTYRASSMQEALPLVRRDLGPTAAVLHTREVPLSRLLRWLPGMRRIEVTASADVVVPSRLPPRAAPAPAPAPSPTATPAPAGARRQEPRSATRSAASSTNCTRWSKTSAAARARRRARNCPSAVPPVHRPDRRRRQRGAGPRTGRASSRPRSAGAELDDALLVKARICADDRGRDRGSRPDRAHAGPLPRWWRWSARPAWARPRRSPSWPPISACAKSASVGLITVDTYRIAAVEQLRTYADIIDLPMKVVSTPAKCATPCARWPIWTWCCMDTAGRSPKDEVKIRELKALLAEAEADEVHLVLSSVASASALTSTAAALRRRRAPRRWCSPSSTRRRAWATCCRCCAPASCRLSYLTNGQNVPDDIEPADSRRLARLCWAWRRKTIDELEC